MPTALQKITYRIHGQRTLLVPSIMLRRGYLETAHLGQIESETHALQGRLLQLYHRSKAVERQKRALPNYAKLTRAERERYDPMIGDAVIAYSDLTDLRLDHLKAMKTKITQFKLN